MEASKPGHPYTFFSAKTAVTFILLNAEPRSTLIRRPRSTRRPKAQMPPRQKTLVDAVHSQSGDHFVLSWAVPPEGLSYPFIKTVPYHFFGNPGDVLLFTIVFPLVAVYLRRGH